MKYLLNIILLLTSVGIYAQVGINTKNIVGVMHIDAKGDNAATPTAAQLANDVIIKNTGDTGIGDIPTARLHIKSAAQKGLRIEDGSQQTGAVLLSDAKGNAHWGIYSFGNEFATLRMTHTAFSYSGNWQQYAASSTAHYSFDSTIDDATATTSSLTLPKGKYLIFLNGLMVHADNMQPYMSVKLTGKYATGVQQDFSETIRSEFILAQTDFYDFTDAVTLNLQIKLMDGSINFKTGYAPVIKPPMTLGTTIDIIVMRLLL